MTSDNTSSFRTKTRITETDRTETFSKGCLHLLFREIPLGSNQHQHTTSANNQVFQQAFILFITMGNKLIYFLMSIVRILVYKRLVICQFM